RSRLAALRERVAAASAECRRLLQDREELESRLSAARTRGLEMQRRRTELEQERAECEGLLAESLQARDRVTGEVAVAEDRGRVRESRDVINPTSVEWIRQLGGGGTAGPKQMDEEDILDRGIHVMAQPPAEGLQDVMLLSGGEKAMPAIALLFAIFQYKPSPF